MHVAGLFRSGLCKHVRCLVIVSVKQRHCYEVPGAARGSASYARDKLKCYLTASRGSAYGIRGGQGITGTGFSPSPSIFRCQYNSTAASYLLIYHLGAGQRDRERYSSTETMSHPFVTRLLQHNL